MSLATLFDHRVILYRPSAGGTDASGFATASFTTGVTPSGLNARPDQSWSGLLADSPLGQVQASTRIWYLHKGFTDVEERDVLDVVQGPTAPNRYRVHSVTRPTNPKVVHHVEVSTMIYEGGIA